MKNVSSFVVLLVFVSACASDPDYLPATYISPTKYENHDCDQLSSDVTMINQRALTLYRDLKNKHAGDNWQTGISLFVFWPTLVFLEFGDGPEADEFSLLKGEYEALKEVSVEKKCDLDIRSPRKQVEHLYAEAKAVDKELKLAKRELRWREREYEKLKDKSLKVKSKIAEFNQLTKESLSNKENNSLKRVLKKEKKLQKQMKTKQLEVDEAKITLIKAEENWQIYNP